MLLTFFSDKRSICLFSTEVLGIKVILDSDLLLWCSLDFNECDHLKGLCEQRCENTIGSYRCACYDGYVYHAEKKACVG